ALYSDEDIYLLDDPLSAVDSEVANHIFDKCICDYLKTKTVVLVTHQIQFIQKATKILVLKEGRSLAFGTRATKKTNLLQRNINTRVQWMGECIGRVLSRFTKDLVTVDEHIPNCLFNLNIDILYLVAIFIVVAVSPVLDHLTTTLNGLVTIRALRAQKHCLQEFYDLQDNHTSSFFMNLCANRAFGLLLECIYLLYLATMSGGTAGLIFYLTIGLSMNLQMTIRNTADLENQMTSVERILEYSELESEESPKEADSRLNVSPDWPLEGSIHFQDVCLTYENSTNETLIEINCEIKGGERVGIVGRTGAGKSSLLAVL
ncbi:unnamed protein product, partial [Oppiella nova]